MLLVTLISACMDKENETPACSVHTNPLAGAENFYNHTAMRPGLSRIRTFLQRCMLSDAQIQPMEDSRFVTGNSYSEPLIANAQEMQSGQSNLFVSTKFSDTQRFTLEENNAR
jgi:hypothetical protein